MLVVKTRAGTKTSVGDVVTVTDGSQMGVPDALKRKVESGYDDDNGTRSSSDQAGEFPGADGVASRRPSVDVGARRPSGVAPEGLDENSEALTPQDEEAADATHGDSRNEVALTDREALLAEIVEDRVEERVTTILSAMVATSGPIPVAEDLHKYSPEHQDRILRMAEAPTTDESARRDRVTDARIEQSNKTMWITPAILFLVLGCSLFCFAVLKNNVAGLGFLAVGVLRMVATYATTFSLSGNRRPASESETKDQQTGSVNK